MAHAKTKSAIKFIQAEAGRKSWVTRRRNLTKLKRKQSQAARKAWATRRKMARS